MRRRGKPLEVSTFPFLAVLLCAMGSLILVLIVMDRKAKLAARYKALAAQTQAAEEQAKVDAARRALLQEREAAASAALQQQRDDLHATLLSQQQLLQAQMKKVQDQLTEAALRLKAELDETGELKKRGESEQARLAAEETALQKTRQALEQAEASTAADRAAKAKMTAQLLQVEATLKDLKAARERDRQTYSVVPYHGKHGESRRPLYIECTRNGIIFYPERVEMSLGPTAAAARDEVRRRIQRQKEYLASIQAKVDEKPYLLLLVRPDGITSYYELQSAVHGLDVEFGYEFVDAAWIFDFSKEVDSPQAKSPIPSPTSTATPSRSGPGSVPGIAMLPPERVNTSGTLANGPSGPGLAGSSAGSAPGIMPGNPATTGVTGIGPGSLAPPSTSTIPQPQTPGAAGPTLPTGTEPGFHSNKPPTTFATRGPRTGQVAGPPIPSGSGIAATQGPSASSPPGAASGTVAEGPGHGSPVGGLPGPILPPGVMGSAQPGGTQAAQPAGPESPAGPQTPATPGAPAATGGGANGSTREKDDSPRFAPPQTTPPAKKPPPPLRVARLSGDRDYIIFVECRPDDVVLYPSRQSFAAQQLARGDQAIVAAVKQMIDRKQALVRPGDLPFRPQVRFLVHPESIRSYHTAYPVLNALGVPQTRQNLDADDDVAAIVVGQ
jgi:hypothetical protein